MTSYATPRDGLPPQTSLHTGRAIFTNSYAVIPRGVMTDIVTSLLPGWKDTRAWIIARPMSGFSETFSQYIMDVAPGGGSDAPEPEAGAEMEQRCSRLLGHARIAVGSPRRHALEQAEHAAHAVDAIERGDEMHFRRAGV